MAPVIEIGESLVTIRGRAIGKVYLGHVVDGSAAGRGGLDIDILAVHRQRLAVLAVVAVDAVVATVTRQADVPQFQLNVSPVSVILLTVTLIFFLQNVGMIVVDGFYLTYLTYPARESFST